MRKLICMILALSMCVCLAGCGTDATALVNERFGIDESRYYALDADVSVTIRSDAVGGSIDYDVFIEGDGDLVHGVKDMTMTADGSEDVFSVKTESWQDSMGSTYVQMSAGEQTSGWQKYDEADYDMSAFLDLMCACSYSPDRITGKTSSEGYRVQWPVEFSEIAGALDPVVDGISAAKTADMGMLTAEALFVGDDYTLSAFSIVSNGLGKDGDVSISVTVLDSEDTSLSMPEFSIQQPTQSGSTEGKWGQPGPNGFLASPTYLDEGSDDGIDRIADAIQVNDIGFNMLEITYGGDAYDGVPHLLYNSGSADEWNATLEVWNYGPSAGDTFTEQVEIFRSVYGEPVAMSDEWAVFAGIEDMIGGYYMSCIGIQDGMLMMCSGTDWTSGDADGAVTNMLLMIDATGEAWGRE